VPDSASWKFWRRSSLSHGLFAAPAQPHCLRRALYAAGAASQADVWALLDKWGSNKDAKGVLAASLERYTAPLWGSVASQASGLSQASILTQELYLEAETKLVFMFAFMAYCKKIDRLPA